VVGAKGFRWRQGADARSGGGAETVTDISIDFSFC
jgi:hypothetical protein